VKKKERYTVGTLWEALADRALSTVTMFLSDLAYDAIRLDKWLGEEGSCRRELPMTFYYGWRTTGTSISMHREEVTDFLGNEYVLRVDVSEGTSGRFEAAFKYLRQPDNGPMCLFCLDTDLRYDVDRHLYVCGECGEDLSVDTWSAQVSSLDVRDDVRRACGGDL